MAIVGLGPKGLFALERLLDHARRLDARNLLEIDVYEPHPVPGSGPVYDPVQPAYLRMNFPSDQLDMWWPSSSAVPPEQQRSFVAWAADENRLGQERYPARAEVGRYLAAGFATLCRHAPPNVTVRVIPNAVTAARAGGLGWVVHGASGPLGTYAEVLVAVGHQTGGPERLGEWSHAAPLVPAVFPVGQMLARERVAPGAAVAIRGFALTFIDCVLALTEGRGGSFVPTSHPYRLRYVPGEDDVGLALPFTRTGRPMLAKPGPGLAVRAPEALARAGERGRTSIAGLAGAVDLARDLLPVLADTACSCLRAAGGPVFGNLPVRIEAWLAEAASGRAGEGRLAPQELIERSLAVGAGLTAPDLQWAMGHSWRNLYPALVARLGGGGIRERDWPAFLRLAAEMERVAFGPPPLNAAKLLALIEAGRVDLSHLRAGTLVSRGDVTVLRSRLGETAIDVVIDAVLPPPGALQHSGLLAQLLADGHARVPAGRRGLEVTADAGCRGLDGSITAGLSAVGRPTEDSVIGNDTLSRVLHPQPERWAKRVIERCHAADVESIPARWRERA